MKSTTALFDSFVGFLSGNRGDSFPALGMDTDGIAFAGVGERPSAAHEPQSRVLSHRYGHVPGESDPGAIWIVLLSSGVVWLCFKVCDMLYAGSQERHGNQHEEEAQAREAANVPAAQIATTLPRSSAPSAPRNQTTNRELHELSIPELTEVYGEAFQKARRQTVLSPSDVFHGNPTQPEANTRDREKESQTNANERTKPPPRTNEEPLPFDWSVVESIRDHADDPLIDAALQSARSMNRTTVPGETKTRTDNDDDDDDDNSVIGATHEKEPSSYSSSRHQSTYLVHPESQSLRFVGGTCMICLEEMTVGETVVWSETKSCPHMYHKDCLASFLAHNCKEQGRLPSTRRNLGHDPCPACRTNFVTVPWSIV